MSRYSKLNRGLLLPKTCRSASDYLQGILMNVPIVRRSVFTLGNLTG